MLCSCSQGEGNRFRENANKKLSQVGLPLVEGRRFMNPAAVDLISGVMMEAKDITACFPKDAC